jgi:pilus assembly protein CpaC
MKTDVELADGQTFVIGGLLDNRDTEVYQKIPFLGDIPIIGNFFKSMSKNRTNTELIVTVTPEIVAPISAGAPVPELKYPTKFLPPNSGIPMNTPDAKDASNTLPPTQPVMSVEGLTESLKEKPLVLDSSSVGFGQSGGGSDANASSAPASTPQ